MSKSDNADSRHAKPGSPEASRVPRAYHHGALKEALLLAAEDILLQDGLAGLTLRETARRAGVSHAAPKNHFGDVRGLMSELAAVGFQRLAMGMAKAASGAADTNAAMDAIGRTYVNFARTTPGLFHLMYRSEALDYSIPALAAAVSHVAEVLKTAVVNRDAGQRKSAGRALDTVGSMAASWCLVHGFATLLVDSRLDPLLAHVPGENKIDILLVEVLAKIKPAKTVLTSSWSWASRGDGTAARSMPQQRGLRLYGLGK